MLLKNGATVKERHARTGVTPVHYLAKTGKVALLAFLVERTWYTVDLGMGGRVEGMLLIHLASLNGHTEVVRMLITWTRNLHNISVSSSGLSPLMCAAQYNQLPVIHVLDEHCANVNYKSTINVGLRSSLRCDEWQRRNCD